MNWQQAHLRMLATLPVRTVEAKLTPERVPTNFCKRFEYQGKVYESISDASRRLRKAAKTLYRLAAEGKARIIERD